MDTTVMGLYLEALVYRSELTAGYTRENTVRIQVVTAATHYYRYLFPRRLSIIADLTIYKLNRYGFGYMPIGRTK